MRATTRVDIRGKRVDEALPIVTRFLDDCIATGIERAEIIHGTGTGALRAAVREFLNASSEIAGYEEPSWELGGPGVTIVRFQ
jgi:DNA mismatch repair protein MutS2